MCRRRQSPSPPPPRQSSRHHCCAGMSQRYTWPFRQRTTHHAVLTTKQSSVPLCVPVMLALLSDQLYCACAAGSEAGSASTQACQARQAQGPTAPVAGRDHRHPGPGRDPICHCQVVSFPVHCTGHDTGLIMFKVHTAAEWEQGNFACFMGEQLGGPATVSRMRSEPSVGVWRRSSTANIAGPIAY